MKFLKLSLVASLALGTLSTASFAQPLEEAIKGVDVSGYLRYRYQDDRYTDQNFQKDNNGNGSADHRWRAVSLFKTPVVDALSLSLGLRYDGRNNIGHGKGNPANTDTPPGSFLGYSAERRGLGSGYDSTIGVSVFQMNITPESTATNVQLGKQYLNTPFTDGTEERGTGILATNSDIPGLTFALGAFDSFATDDTGLTIDKPLYLLAAIYGVDLEAAGNLGAQGWVINVADIFKYMGFLQFDYSVSVVKLSVQYGLSSLENNSDSVVWGVLTNGTSDGSLPRINNLAFNLTNPGATYSYPADKANVANKNDLLDVKFGLDLSSINVPLTFGLGYMMNFADGTTVSVDEEGFYNKAGALWFDNQATGVSLGILSKGFTPYGASKDLDVLYTNVLYGIPIADKTLSIGLDYVYGTNKINDILATTDGGQTTFTSSTKVDFQEITPRLIYQHSKNLRIQTFYAMLNTKNKTDGFVEGAGYTSTEKRNRFRFEVRYNF